MPGPAHETLVALLHERPDLIDLLLRALGRPGLRGPVEPVDSTLRITNPLEVRPDLVFTVSDGRRWLVVEVQLAIDEAKRRRWIAGAAALFDAHDAMGDVLVFTHDASVGAWALQVAHVVGPLGTVMTLTPVVVVLTRAEVDVLLATGRPELAVFAAWAVHDQRGRDAQSVVRVVAERIEATADVELRTTLARAMISMLGDPLLAVLQEMWMNPIVFPESPALKALREMLQARARDEGKTEGKTVGKAEALLTVLRARHLLVDEATRARIDACADPLTLDRWIVRAVSATTLDEVFASDHDAE
jgi:hypothetical protein